MNHQEVRKRMGEYLQGDLDLAQRALFDAHLDGCEACARDLGALRQTVHLLRELPTPEVPPHLAERVVARIEDGEAQARWWDGLVAFWDWIDPSRYLPPLAAASLTAAVVIVGVRDLGWEIPGARVPEAPAVARQDAAPSPARSRSASEEAAMGRVVAEPQPRAAGPTLRSTAVGPALPANAEADLARELRARAFGARAPEAAPVARSALSDEAEAVAETSSPEDDLRLALDDPRAFIVRFHTLSPEEARERWLASVARRAHQRQAVADVARRLRTTGDEGHAVARRFEGAAQAAAYTSEAR